ncbi:MAG: ATP-binding protein, partial [Burkholderiales bacterium]
MPRAPREPAETGLDFSFLIELITKALYLRGQLRLVDLASHVKLAPGVLEPVLNFMRVEHMCEMVRRGDADSAMAFSLTELGRERARDFLRRNHYAGPAPVNLDAYISQVQFQSITEMGVTRQKLKTAFAGVVVKEQLLNQFGAAMNSGRAIFVYGPPGSGKTYISERLLGLMSGAIAIPYALSVDNEVIQIFDPVAHTPVSPKKPAGVGLDIGRNEDARWML